MGPVTGKDGVARCPWAYGDELLLTYHDTEWGVPVEGDAAYYERLTLEAFQSGLSWLTVLRKREAFREAFAGFDPDKVAEFDDEDRARLLADAGIVRNRLKIEAAIANAQATVRLRDAEPAAGEDSDTPRGLAALVASYAPPVWPVPVTTEDLVGVSQASVDLAKGLKKEGFRFVGPTTMHALLQALGHVDDHLAGCHRRAA